MNWLVHHLPKTGLRGVRFWVGRALGPAMLEFGPRGRSGTLPRDVYLGHGEKLLGMPPTSALIPGTPPAFCVEGSVPHLPGKGPFRPTPVRVVMGHYVSERAAGSLGWGDAYCNATIIRDPAERLFSQYKHFERQNQSNPSFPSFEGWVERVPVPHQKTIPRICYCLECQFDGFDHSYEPMCHFHGSRVPASDPGSKDALARAKRFLERCRVYSLEHTFPHLIADLRADFDLDFKDYKPEHVSGFGAQVSKEHRRLVAKNHPLDAELYEWAMGRAV